MGMAILIPSLHRLEQNSVRKLSDAAVQNDWLVEFVQAW